MGAELPELTYDLAVAIGKFAERIVVVSADDVAGYRAVTGDQSPLYERFVPPGLIGIFSRQSWLSEHRMPPGGIALRHDAEWIRPALIDRPLVLQASVGGAERAGDRRSLTLDPTVCQDGEHVARASITARWPKGPAWRSPTR